MIQVSKEKYEGAHKHSSKHRAEILTSASARCFHCGRTFPPSLIVEWIDDNQTALCPLCGIDSVLGDASGYSLTDSFIYLMNEFWFRDYEPAQLERAHDRKWRERVFLESHHLCGCFYCVKIFDTIDIKEWVRPEVGGGMALCPYCGIDSVMGIAAPFSMMLGFLHQMYKYWFQRDAQSSQSKSST